MGVNRFLMGRTFEAINIVAPSLILPEKIKKVRVKKSRPSFLKGMVKFFFIKNELPNHIKLLNSAVFSLSSEIFVVIVSDCRRNSFTNQIMFEIM